MKRILPCFLFLIVLFFSGCASHTLSSVSPLADRATLSWLREHVGFEESAFVRSYMRGLCLRLEVGIPERVASSDFSCEIEVLRSDQPNAFSFGKNHIVVTRGLLLSTTQEAELASIVAHEMAHHLLGHPLVAAEGGGALDRPHLFFTEDQEQAADSLGLEILSGAHFDTSRAAFALTIPYRAVWKNVSPEIDQSLRMRMGRLYSEGLQRHSFSIAPAATDYEEVKSLLRR